MQKFHIDDLASPKSVSVGCIVRLHIRLHTKSHFENEGRREKRNWSISTRSRMVDEEPQVCIRPRLHKEWFEKGFRLSIPHSRKYKGNGYKLSAKRLLGSFGQTSVIYDWLMVALDTIDQS